MFHRQASERVREWKGWLRPTLELLGWAAAGGILAMAGLDWWQGPLPLALALLAATPESTTGAAVLVGAAAGYFSFWGLREGFEPAAIGGLIYLAQRTFSLSGLDRAAWFGPAAVFVFTGAVRLAWMLALPFSWQTLAQFLGYSAAGALMTLALEQRSGSGTRRLLTLGAGLTLGLSRLPLGLNLGLLPAAALTVLMTRLGSFGPAAGLVLGLALDLPVGRMDLYPAALGLGALGAGSPLCPDRGKKALAFLGMTGGILLLSGRDAGDLLALSLGTVLGLVLPLRSFESTGVLEDRLRLAARSLEQLGKDQAPQTALEQSAGELFDRVTGELCQDCPRHAACWELDGETTYRVLAATARPMLRRGRTAKEDYPEGFAARCCRFDALLGALDRELDQQLYRHKFSVQAQETAQVALDQLRELSALLRTLAGSRDCQGRAAEQYVPELSILSAGRFAHPISGDRTAAFRAGEGVLYVLLCDGMGTGPEAARESGRAVEALQGLLQAGMEPEQALKLLNGSYVLRGDGAFATVDLARIDLLTGSLRLYKWGAAASWLLRDGRLVRLGSAAPPPGLFAFGQPERLSEELGRGEYLVLLTDGIGDSAAAQALSEPGETGTRELAARLLARARSLTGDSDDMTAAVVCLHPARGRRAAAPTLQTPQGAAAS